MLRLRLRYLMNTRGISNPYQYLLQHGFSPNVATRYSNGKMLQPKLSQINKLCTLMNCTPNDLFEYVPSQSSENLPEDHPLLTLVRNDHPFNIVDKLNNLSFDQIKEVEKFISNIKNGEK